MFNFALKYYNKKFENNLKQPSITQISNSL